MNRLQKKIIPVCIAIVGSVFCVSSFTATLFAQEQDLQNRDVNPLVDLSAPPVPDTYYKAAVIKILDKSDKDYIQSSEIVQKIRVRIEDGDAKGNEVPAENNIPTNAQTSQTLKVGDEVVLIKSASPDGIGYYVVDLHRTTPLIWIALFFAALVMFFGRLRGLTSLVGLGFSIAVLALYIVPQILAGKDPLIVGMTGSFFIMVISLYLAHGFNKRTSIALGSSLITLCIAVASAVFFVGFAKLLGTGTEDALYLQLSQGQSINLSGLLLAGIIIGTLGVLDDVTIGQTAAVAELQKANPLLSKGELYHRGLAVGKEHIASLVNTLALAYAGASLPLFLLFTLNASQPLWVIINSQDIAEEIVRTLVGSIALILAVPISTWCAAFFLSKQQSKNE